MTKDVLINVSGLQIDLDSNENVEIITRGQYYLRNNHQFIVYDEYLDDTSKEVTKNTLKITPDSIELTKRGVANVHMVFEKNKETVTYYDTPFGSLLMGITTSDIKVHETNELINIIINYGLSINYNHVTDCNINIKVTSIIEE